MWKRRTNVVLTTRQKISQTYRFLGITLALTGLLLTLLVIFSQNQAEIDQKGVQTDAVVTKAVAVKNKRNLFNVTYRFSVPVPNAAPQVYERMAVVDRETYNRLPVGAKIQVKYLPQDPNSSRITSVAGDNNWLTVMVIFLASNAFMQVLALVQLAYLFRVEKRELAGKAFYG